MWNRAVRNGLRLMGGLALGLLVGAWPHRSSPSAGGPKPVPGAINPIDGAEMVWVPAGEFMMGSDREDADERPVHRVRLTSGYWLYRSPVTNAQYGKFLANSPRHDQPRYWNDTRFNAAQQPVVGVSWRDAQEYCAWARCRLPTEAEWEYAARGTQGRTFPWGEEPPDSSRAVFGRDAHTGRPELVGSRRAGQSWCGTLDMVGNVGQWCADWYDDRYYQVSPAVNPPGSEEERFRVVRGSSWQSDPLDLRAAFRSGGAPEKRTCQRGFRPAVSP